MQEWCERFWNEHGTRLVFMGIATIFGGAFSWSGNDKLVGAGYTILIGVAMLCMNKARSMPKAKPKPKEAVLDPTDE